MRKEVKENETTGANNRSHTEMYTMANRREKINCQTALFRVSYQTTMCSDSNSRSRLQLCTSILDSLNKFLLRTFFSCSLALSHWFLPEPTSFLKINYCSFFFLFLCLYSFIFLCLSLVSFLKMHFFESTCVFVLCFLKRCPGEVLYFSSSTMENNTFWLRIQIFL